MFFPFFPTLGVQNLFFPGRYLPVNTTVKTGYRPKPSNPDFYMLNNLHIKLNYSPDALFLPNIWPICVISLHDDVIKWKHFPLYWPFVRGIHRSPVNSLHKGQWRGALMFSLIWTWMNGWVNNREAGDLRHHGAHYDVTVMNRHNSLVINWLVVPQCLCNLTSPEGVLYGCINLLL